VSRTSRARVLIVDDDAGIRRSLQRGLGLAGFDVETVGDGVQAKERLRIDPPDAVVLDVRIPPPDGIEICRQLRARGEDVPVLMLSALEDVEDRVRGLAAGADDYVVKPFALRELELRLHALLRRAPRPSSALRLATLRIDPERRTASVDGQPLELTRREFDLLEVFARNSGLVLGRGRLLELVWGYDFDVRTDVVDTFVSYLRRKLEADGRPRLIHTVRGVGFVLRPPAEVDRR
jgi:DNA-binding response OmpR family regulator